MRRPVRNSVFVHVFIRNVVEFELILSDNEETGGNAKNVDVENENKVLHINENPPEDVHEWCELVKQRQKVRNFDVN